MPRARSASSRSRAGSASSSAAPAPQDRLDLRAEVLSSPCRMSSGRSSSGARLPLMPCTSTRIAAAPARGWTGRTSAPPKRPSRRRAGRASASARWIMVAVPAGLAMRRHEAHPAGQVVLGHGVGGGLCRVGRRPCRVLACERAGWRAHDRSFRRAAASAGWPLSGAPRRPRSRARARQDRCARCCCAQARPAWVALDQQRPRHRRSGEPQPGRRRRRRHPRRAPARPLPALAGAEAASSTASMPAR